MRDKSDYRKGMGCLTSFLALGTQQCKRKPRVRGIPCTQGTRMKEFLKEPIIMGDRGPALVVFQLYCFGMESGKELWVADSALYVR